MLAKHGAHALFVRGVQMDAPHKNALGLQHAHDLAGVLGQVVGVVDVHVGGFAVGQQQFAAAGALNLRACAEAQGGAQTVNITGVPTAAQVFMSSQLCQEVSRPIS